MRSGDITLYFKEMILTGILDTFKNPDRTYDNLRKTTVEN